MKIFLSLAILTVASAIPLKESEPVSQSVPDGPIPFEMLRNAAAFPMPVWRDLPINNLPEGDAYVTFFAIPDDVRDNSLEASNVKVVDAFLLMPAEVGEDITNYDDKVKVVYALESDNDILSNDKLDVPHVPYPQPPTEVDMKYVVDEPATFDLNNIHVPIDAHDTA